MTNMQATRISRTYQYKGPTGSVQACCELIMEHLAAAHLEYPDVAKGGVALNTGIRTVRVEVFVHDDALLPTARSVIDQAVQDAAHATGYAIDFAVEPLEHLQTAPLQPSSD
ncbi:hypothetical protein [Streptomyces sp. NPDC055085]